MLTIVFCLALSVNAQRSLNTISDSNFLIHDYIPDTILYGVSGLYNYGDSLSIDINDDGIKDFKFYYEIGSLMYFYVSSLNNCSYKNLNVTDTITLTNNNISWYMGASF